MNNLTKSRKLLRTFTTTQKTSTLNW